MKHLEYMCLNTEDNNLELTENQEKVLNEYLEQVLVANKTLNLTRISSIKEGKLLHLEDSLVALQEFKRTPPGRYADIGTGGGFPGVPLSIATNRNVVLVDSVTKKITSIDSIINKMGLQDQIDTYAGRVEDLALEQPNGFDVISARALTSLPSLIELASPLLKQGGQLISYKAKIEESELSSAKSLKEKLGMKLISIRETTLSDFVTQRTILVFEKVSEPTVKLPRRAGMAQKRPYKP